MVKNKRHRQNNLYSYLLILMILAVFILLLGIKVVPSVGTDKIYMKEQVIHQVAPGETLWKIALQYKDEGCDTRQMVDEIKEINHLEGKYLNVGDQLIIYKSFE